MVSLRSVTDVAVIFPGQGSQAPGMADRWRGDARLERALDALGFDPFAESDSESGSAGGVSTRAQQPAILICSVLAFEDDGPAEPCAAAGHSLGEYAALVAAGSLDFEDALALVAERGAAMEEAARRAPGGMLALLGATPEDAAGIADASGCVVANDNAPGQLVLAGALDALAQAQAAAQAARLRARRLPVAGAFHSPLMEPAAARLRAALARTPFAPLRFPVYSCATAAPFADPRAELAAGLLAPVRWRETLIALHDQAGARDFMECGPGRVLSGLVKRTLRVAA